MALQSNSCDLVEAYNDAQNLVKVLEKVRNEKERYEKLFTRASDIAATVDVEPSKPRTAARQRGRANAEADNTQEYYLSNFFFPFVDHVLANSKSRFSEEITDAIYGFYLIPNQLHKHSDEVVEKVKAEFQDELPFPDSFEAEVRNSPLHFCSLCDCLGSNNQNIYYNNPHVPTPYGLNMYTISTCSCILVFFVLCILQVLRWKSNLPGNLLISYHQA